MSLGYLRSDALTELASCGQEAFDKVEKTTRELLSEVPGSWMPDDVVTSLELVERAYRNTTTKGKHSIVLALLGILDDLGKVWLKCSLTPSESRQLLSAMELGVAWHGESIPLSCQIAQLLYEAKNTPQLFSVRITPIPEIVGENDDALTKFVQSLWSKLPNALIIPKEKFVRTDIKDRLSLRERLISAKKWIFETGFRHKPENAQDLLKTWISTYRVATPIKSTILSDLHFFTTRLEGKPGIIKIQVRNKLHFVGVCRIAGGSDALEVASDDVALKRFFTMLKQDVDPAPPILNAGYMEIHENNRLNIIEGAYTRARSRFLESLAEITASHSNLASVDEIESILWHNIRDKIALKDLTKHEQDVLKINNTLLFQAAEITESFQTVLTSSRRSFKKENPVCI